MAGYGLSFPLRSEPLASQRSFVQEIEGLGYTSIWSLETDYYDGLTPLALASQWSDHLRLGSAVIPAQTRGPAVLAMSAAALAEAAPGRFAIGVGSSSEFFVSMHNARPFERPFHQTRDVVRFLKRALAGKNASGRYDTFTIRGFQLRAVPESPPPVLVGALRPGMLEMAGREGDGAILNFVTPEDLSRVIPHVKKYGAEKEIAGRIYVGVTDDATVVRDAARSILVPYLNVPTYRAHQEWLGNERYYADTWRCWDAGDFHGAAAALSNEAIDRHFIHGSADTCRARIQEYVDAGLETPIVSLVEEALDPREAARLLAPKG
jgi:probable F420-dependent oxidoreductase